MVESMLGAFYKKKAYLFLPPFIVLFVNVHRCHNCHKWRSLQHAPGSRSQVIAFTRKLRRHPVNAYPELSNIRWILKKLLYLIS